MDLPARQAVTRNEAIVLNVLRSAHRALKAYEILGRTTERGVRAPTQVYRALGTLADRGLVHRIETLNAYLLCDHGPHAGEAAFAVCGTCGKVEEIPLEEMAAGLVTLAEKQGFANVTAQVEFSGTCAGCVEAAAEPGAAGGPRSHG